MVELLVGKAKVQVKACRLMLGINLNRLAEGGRGLVHVAGFQIHGSEIIGSGKIGAVGLQGALQGGSRRARPR